MSESSDEPQVGISDDELPPDLVPGDDNPLAEGLDPDDPDGPDDDLLEGGKIADEMEREREDDADADEAGSDPDAER